MRRNVEGFLGYWGRPHTLFFTMSDMVGGQGTPPKEFAKRWDSWKTHRGAWMKGFLKVLEPQVRGAPHYHNLAAVDFDTKPDAFDWDAFNLAHEAYQAKEWPTFKAMKKRYVGTATPELRALWSECSPTEMARYGLGRVEILPLRKNALAVAEYVGKYLDKGDKVRTEIWKGVRRVELDRSTSKEWKVSSQAFSWNSPGATMWRGRVGELAAALGVSQEEGVPGISKLLGPKWAYRMRGAIHTATDDDWQTLLTVTANHARHRFPQVSECNGDNAAW